MLARALLSLVNSKCEKPAEIIVVNGGGPETDEVVAKIRVQTHVPIVLIKTKNKNLATSRNVGLEYCAGEIVAMTDDDAEVFPDWVTSIRAQHAEHPEAGAVGGQVLGAESDKSILSRLADLVTFPSPEAAGYVRTIPGVNISYKREVVQQIGLQDTELFRGEDVDYNWRVQQSGYKVYYDPSIKVLHHHRPSFRKLLHQHYMYGRAYYLVRKKWTNMYCVYPHGISSVRDILKLGFFFVAIVYEPFKYAAKMSSTLLQLAAYPMLVVNQIVWRFGMVRQGITDVIRRN